MSNVPNIDQNLQPIMSTTDQRPTTEQIDNIINRIASDTLQNLRNTLIDDSISYDIPFLPSKDAGRYMDDILHQLNTKEVKDSKGDQSDPQKHHLVKTTICQQLSKKHRIKLSREFDGCGEMECVPFVGQEPYDATLYLRVNVPKDPVLKEKFSNGTLSRDHDCFFYPDQLDSHYVPLRVIRNIRGKFRFFDRPLNLCVHPFTELSIEITFKARCLPPRSQYILMDVYVFDKSWRNQLLKTSYIPHLSVSARHKHKIILSFCWISIVLPT